MINLNLLFGVLTIASLVYTIIILLIICHKHKKYLFVEKKTLSLKNNNNSKIFAKQSLLSENLDEQIIDDVLEEIYKK